MKQKIFKSNVLNNLPKAVFSDLEKYIYDITEREVIGTQVIFKFDNDFGASVIREVFNQSQLEIGVLQFHLNTSTNTYRYNLVGDPLRYLSIDEASEVLNKIKACTSIEELEVL